MGNPAGQPTNVWLQDGGDTFTYDPNSGRMTQWKSTSGATSQTGNLTWNANGTLGQVQVTEGFNTANSKTCGYTYDGITRLAG